MRRILSTMLMLLVSGALVAGETAKPAATIGATAVSQDELEKALGTKLMRLRTEEYNIRRGVLEELIATKLVDAEAARRHVTAEELLKSEVDAKIAVPTAAEIEPIYDGVAERYPGMTKEQAMNDIAEAMRRKRLTVRRTEFVKELRAAAGVKVNLQPPRVQVEAAGPSRGGANAPVTIVEFSDFECPFCGRAVETLQQIEKTYGDRVRIVFRDYPLVMHRTAKRAAEAAHCADEQGKFWPMHDRLFTKGGPITDPDIARFAQQAKLDQSAFDACLASGKYKEAWKPSLDDGTRIGVTSTPTFFINGRMMVGAPPIEAFTRIIDEELANTAAPRPANAVAKLNAQ
ncbi:MAG TPA: thioredoxin domain-containing protein [Thermoanaerobaculia bacterium]|nr:thioredoxin domain-containing protein [Thermoanaerobaculia bacterium]